MDLGKLDELKELILRYSFRIGDFTLTSGAKSNYYIDMKPTMCHPDGAVLIAQLILELMEEGGVEPDGVGGMELGAVYPTVAVQVVAALQGKKLTVFTTRKEAKGHGTKRKIEGCAQKGDKVVVIEDVTTTGGSALKSVQSATDAGMEVLAVISLVNRCQGADQVFAEAGIPLYCLFKVGGTEEKPEIIFAS